MTKTQKLSVEEVKNVAKLANLPLSEVEIEKFQGQLDETINYINDLKEIDTKNIPVASQVTGKTNEFRDDEITPGLSQEDALKNADNTHNGFFMSKITWE